MPRQEGGVPWPSVQAGFEVADALFHAAVVGGNWGRLFKGNTPKRSRTSSTRW
jgi:hypothetical protein